MKKQMVIFSNIAAEKFALYFSKKKIYVDFFVFLFFCCFNKLRSICCYFKITNSSKCFLFNEQI
jgi:hypothetical protein